MKCAFKQRNLRSNTEGRAQGFREGGQPHMGIVFLAPSSQNYWVTQKLPQMYAANHATFPIQIRKSKEQISGNLWVTQ